LFTHVVNRLDLDFAYDFQSRETHRLNGRIAVAATVQSSAGWRRTIPLGGPVSFRGASGLASTTVELDSLLALLRTVEASTGVRSTYTLTLTPTVTTGGSVGGLPLHGVFAPAMTFSLNPLELQPLAPGAAISGGRVPASAFTRRASGTASGRRTEAMPLSLGILSLPVGAAREISLAAVALITVLVALLMGLARPRRRGESAVIRARYGGLIIPVERVWQQPGVAVIDVGDIEALVRIADHYDRSILHERTDYGEAFWVTDESGQFRYWIPAEDGLSAAGYADLTDGPAGLESLGWPEPVAAASPEDAPTLEFAALAGAIGDARATPGWGGGESVAYSEAPVAGEPGTRGG
jgi:hypothetical protein